MKSSCFNRKHVYTAIIWIFLFILVVYLLFENFLTISTSFIAICALYVGCKKCWGDSFDDLMFPRVFLDRVKGLKIYKIFFVISPEKQWVAAVLFLNCFVLLWIFFSIVTRWFNPIIDLYEMEKHTGVIEKYQHGRNSRKYKSGSYLSLRTDKGELLKFELAEDHKDYLYLKELSRNEVVTVWSQYLWRFPPEIRMRFVYQLKHKGHYITKYSKKRLLRLEAVLRWFDKILIFWFVGTMLIVWIKSNKYIQEINSNDKYSSSSFK